MLLARCVLLACACALAACKSLHSEKAEQAFTVAIGEGSLGSGGWNAFENPWVFSASYTVQAPDWPCAIETGLQLGGAEGPNAVVQRDMELSEFWIGAAKIWGRSSAFRLQAGAGLRFARAELLGPGFIFDEELDTDYSLGLYAHVGGFVHVGGPFSIGLDARWADGEDYSLENQSRDALLTQLLLTLRWDI